jgi:hypothetical protein
MGASHFELISKEPGGPTSWSCGTNPRTRDKIRADPLFKDLDAEALPESISFVGPSYEVLGRIAPDFQVTAWRDLRSKTTSRSPKKLQLFVSLPAGEVQVRGPLLAAQGGEVWRGEFNRRGNEVASWGGPEWAPHSEIDLFFKVVVGERTLTVRFMGVPIALHED